MSPCPHRKPCSCQICLQMFDSSCCAVQCQIGTHFFGHAYLTSLLLPTMKDCAPSRIVWTTSAAEAAGDVDWNNLAYVLQVHCMALLHCLHVPCCTSDAGSFWSSGIKGSQVHCLAVWHHLHMLCTTCRVASFLSFCKWVPKQIGCSCPLHH